jgi:putative lipoic acid-binding regulatory protein
MWPHVEDFEDAVVSVALQFDAALDRGSVKRRPRKGGNYLGLTTGCFVATRSGRRMSLHCRPATARCAN